MQSICVPVQVKAGVNLEEVIEEREEALYDAGVPGMLELRCDLATPRLMLEAFEFTHLPVILTVRPTWEGGLCEKDDEYRTGLWEQAIETGVEYVDVELVAWERHKTLRDRISEAAEKNGTKIILSHHVFEGRPKDFDARISRLRRVKQADVLKIAWKADDLLDAIEALKVMARLRAEEPRPAFAIAMGEEGLISRLLGKKYGAPFTFAAFDRQSESAPGQPTLADLLEIYRWEELKKDTPVYGVVGWPVTQSKSPLVHNAGFDVVSGGVDGIYVPLAVRPGPTAFAQVIDALRAVPHMNLRGVSVTIPHKESAFKYVVDRAQTATPGALPAKIDDLSWRIGVLNTIVWGTDAMRGLNSDYDGAMDALAAAWDGQRTSLAGKRVAVLGAGGVARAVVAGLVASGTSVVVYNRTLARAEALVADLGDGKAIAAPWTSLRNADCDAFINCTPLGMAPHADSCPMDFDPPWGPETVVFDTVYHPEMTRFLQLAQAKGAKVVKGTEMFLRQAAIQFQAFTGRDAPVEEFRRVLAPQPG
jgi:3-dehydroquinate dehydratase / shikimate dehydrogenase